MPGTATVPVGVGRLGQGHTAMLSPAQRAVAAHSPHPGEKEVKSLGRLLGS